MKKTIALATAALLSMSSAALAAGHTAEVRTPSGKTVWYLGGVLDDVADGGSNPSLTRPEFPNPRGNTANAAPGLTNSVGKGGLTFCFTDPESEDSCD